jgi:sec-independent protein translocase protein TatC
MARFRAPLGIRTVDPDERLSVTDHLDELRRRILVSIAALVVAFVVAYVFRDAVLEFLTRPLPPEQQRVGLITLSPTEPFFTVLKVCLWTAILLALPVWLYQLYAYVIPAVGTQSRRRMLAIVAAVSGLFIVGVAFGYYVVLPVALQFFLGFGGEQFTSQLRASEYFGFATTLMLAAGITFEVPVAMTAFARLGLVTAAVYRRQWRLALVIIAAVAALLPGGDPLSMMLLMAPMIVLYAIGVWLASILGGPPIWERAHWTGEPEESGGDGPVDPGVPA